MMKCPMCGRTVVVSHETAKAVCTACDWGGDAPVLTSTRGDRSWRRDPVVVVLDWIARVIVVAGVCAFAVYDFFIEGNTAEDLIWLFGSAIPMMLMWWALKP